MKSQLLYYDFGLEVEAFSTKINSQLPYYVIQSHQRNGDEVAIINDRTTKREQLEGIDALITDLIECPIGVHTADCVPLLLYDPDEKVVAAVHSGWRGTVLHIVNKTISIMSQRYGTKVENIKAIIGPSIGPDSFQVREDVIEKFTAAGFPMQKILLSKTLKTTRCYYIDLWKANQYLLEMEGVKPESIFITGICSYLNHKEFYSARYLKDNKCGRTITSIKLKDK